MSIITKTKKEQNALSKGVEGEDVVLKCPLRLLTRALAIEMYISLFFIAIDIECCIFNKENEFILAHGFVPWLRGYSDQ